MKKTLRQKEIQKPKTYLTLIGLMTIFILLDAYIQGSKDQIFVKFFLSIFTIPLFIGFIGYAHDYKKMKDLSWLSWFKSYAFRPIVAYVIAVTIYAFLIYSGQIETYGFVDYLFKEYPKYILRHSYDAFFRLSFFIAMPFYSLILYVFTRYVQDMKKYFYVLLWVSLLSLTVILLPQTFRLELGMIYIFLVEKNLMLYNLIFFATGVLLRHYVFNIEAISHKIIVRNATYTLFALLITSLFFMLNRSDFFSSSSQTVQTIILSFQTFVIYVLNFAILVQLAYLIQRNIIKPIASLQHLGKIYQGILLWYGLIIFISYRLSGSSVLTYDYSKYYLWIIFFTFIFLSLIYFLRNSTKLKYVLLLEIKEF